MHLASQRYKINFDLKDQVLISALVLEGIRFVFDLMKGIAASNTLYVLTLDRGVLTIQPWQKLMKIALKITLRFQV